MALARLLGLGLGQLLRLGGGLGPFAQGARRDVQRDADDEGAGAAGRDAEHRVVAERRAQAVAQRMAAPLERIDLFSDQDAQAVHVLLAAAVRDDGRGGPEAALAARLDGRGQFDEFLLAEAVDLVQPGLFFRPFDQRPQGAQRVRERGRRRIVGGEEVAVPCDDVAALAGFGILQQVEQPVVGALLVGHAFQCRHRGVGLAAADERQGGQAGHDQQDHGREPAQPRVAGGGGAFGGKGIGDQHAFSLGVGIVILPHGNPAIQVFF